MERHCASNPMLSEVNQEMSVPHFAWFHPGNYFIPVKASSLIWEDSHASPESGVAAVPISSMQPTDETAGNGDISTEPPKPKKRKTSKKDPNNTTPKAPKQKKANNAASNSTKSKKPSSVSAAKRERKDLNFAAYETNMDLSGIPAPVCTCTGVPRRCYRWGVGGWQSSCCTINISEYPLPMSTTRPGSRTAGRKMSHGAYEKLLQRLAAQGYDLSQAIDLKEHWARHGTNKFVTIK